MKKLVPLGLVIAMLVAAVAVSSPTEVKAQGAGFVSSLLNRMERNRQSLKSLRASIDMVKYNAQIRDEEKRKGTVLYVPAAGKNAYVRVDWNQPRETLAVADGQFTLFIPRLNMAYKGKAGQGGKNTKTSAALEFMNMSRQQLAARYNLEYMGEEKLWGGVATTHVKLVPKSGASFKWAEAWIDAGGMPVQTKVIERNDDSTTVRLTNMQRNVGISMDEFTLKLDSKIKIVPA